MIDLMKRFNNDTNMMYNHILAEYLRVLCIFDSFKLYRGDCKEDNVNTSYHICCDESVDDFCQHNIITDGNYALTNISTWNKHNKFTITLTNATYLIVKNDGLSLHVNVNTLDEKANEIMAKKNMLSAPKYCVS